MCSASCRRWSSARTSWRRRSTSSMPRSPRRRPPSSRRAEPAATVAGEPTTAAAASEVDAGEDEDAFLGEVLHRGVQALAAGAGVLDAAVGHLVGAEARHVADDHATDLELSRGAEGGLQVAGEDPRLQPEPAVVDPS